MAGTQHRRRVGTVRPSHLMFTGGVGALIDLPNFPVLVRGLDDWRFDTVPDWAPLHEPRLLAAVGKLLGAPVAQLRLSHLLIRTIALECGTARPACPSGSTRVRRRAASSSTLELIVIIIWRVDHGPEVILRTRLDAVDAVAVRDGPDLPLVTATFVQPDARIPVGPRMFEDCLNAKVRLAFGEQKGDDRLFALHEYPPAWRHQNLAELRFACVADFVIVAFRRLGVSRHRCLGQICSAPLVWRTLSRHHAAGIRQTGSSAGSGGARQFCR